MSLCNLLTFHVTIGLFVLSSYIFQFCRMYEAQTHVIFPIVNILHNTMEQFVNNNDNNNS